MLVNVAPDVQEFHSARSSFYPVLTSNLWMCLYGVVNHRLMFSIMRYWLNGIIQNLTMPIDINSIGRLGWAESFIALRPLRPRQNGRPVADHIFTFGFLKENYCILIDRNGLFTNNLTLARIMACWRKAHKPLSEPIMVLFTDWYRHQSNTLSNVFDHMWLRYGKLSPKIIPVS